MEYEEEEASGSKSFIANWRSTMSNVVAQLQDTTIKSCPTAASAGTAKVFVLGVAKQSSA